MTPPTPPIDRVSICFGGLDPDSIPANEYSHDSDTYRFTEPKRHPSSTIRQKQTNSAQEEATATCRQASTDLVRATTQRAATSRCSHCVPCHSIAAHPVRLTRSRLMRRVALLRSSMWRLTRRRHRYAIRIASSASVYAPSQAAAVIVDDVHKRASQPLNRPVAHQPRSRQPATSRPASANDVRSNEGDLTDDAKDALRHAWQLDHPRAAAEHDAPRPDSADGQSRQPVVARSYEELKQELEGIDIDELSAALQAAMRDSDQ